MRLEFCFNGCQCHVQSDAGVDIAIRQDFDAKQPGFFAAPQASRDVWTTPGFVGDTRQGGSCNVDTIRLVPHCNGTHTEGVGHVTAERVDLLDHPPPAWMSARLISVNPGPLGASAERYSAAKQADEAVIAAAILEPALAQFDATALIVRTLPNPVSKTRARYHGENSHPYFTEQAMLRIRQAGVQHLFVDMPSIDRADTHGALINHHLFWDLTTTPPPAPTSQAYRRTITEFVYVPNDLSDGDYLLCLQLPRLAGDAVPSRPLLFRIFH